MVPVYLLKQTAGIVQQVFVHAACRPEFFSSVENYLVRSSTRLALTAARLPNVGLT